MELIEYRDINSFLQDIIQVIEDNFISHYLLFEASERLLNGEEEIYYGCTVQDKQAIEIIYMYTNQSHYFFGTTENKLAVDLLSQRLPTEQFNSDLALFGNIFIIAHLIETKKLNFQNIRHRHYMSLKSCAFNKENVKGRLYLAQENDYYSLVPLILGFYREEFDGKGLQPEESILSNFKSTLLSNSGSYCWYWKTSERITTLISIQELPGERIYIYNIYTTPEFRNKGISKVALGALLIELLNSGNIEIGLNVKVTNETAIGLFSSLGMKKIYETGIYKLQ